MDADLQLVSVSVRSPQSLAPTQMSGIDCPFPIVELTHSFVFFLQGLCDCVGDSKPQFFKGIQHTARHSHTVAVWSHSVS